MEKRKEMIANAGSWLDLDLCEKAYRLENVETTWSDYTFQWYNDLTEEEQMWDENLENSWDMDRYYADFEKWWKGHPFKEQERIYNAITK